VRIFAKPVSTTNCTPGIVSDVSAMVVASTILRWPLGARANARVCASRGSAAKSGQSTAGA
jgi:hypothetical protein